MKTKIDKVPPWSKRKRFNRASFDEAFSRLGTTNGFINPREIKTTMTSPLVRK